MPTAASATRASSYVPDTSFSALVLRAWSDFHCASVLANGCILDTGARFSHVPATGDRWPYICPPAGLGSRFVSVMRASSFFGGVTDTGNIVVFGHGAAWNRCAFIRGPFTAMATSTTLYPTTAVGAALFSVSSGVDLCALDAAGALHCWAELPSGWAAATQSAWSPAASEGPNRPLSACTDVTANATFLRPSPRLCPQAAAASAAAAAAAGGSWGNVTFRDCVAPHGLSSFAVSPCQGMGSYIVGVRASDGLPLAWLIGGDTWEQQPAAGSLASPFRGLFNSSALTAVASDPRVPPFLRCTDAAGRRAFVGRAADGSGYWVEPEVWDQGSGAAALMPPRRVLNASSVGLLATPSLRTYMDAADYGTLTAVVVVSNGFQRTYADTQCGPFAPFGFAIPAQRAGVPFLVASGGIRTADASLQLNSAQMSHLLPSSPIQVSAMVMVPGANVLCVSFAPASSVASVDSSPLPLTWEVKCAGPPTIPSVTSGYRSATTASMVTTINQHSHEFGPRCMSAPPSALAASRRTMVTAPQAFVNTGADRTRFCARCAIFYGYRTPGFPQLEAVPASAPIVNASALATHPASGAFACAIIAPDGTLQCVGDNFPANAAGSSRPSPSTPCSLLASTNTTVCVTLTSSNWLWCFADDISQLAAAATAAGMAVTVPAGANAANALLLQINVTALAASEAVVCAVFASAGSSALLCLGPASDPVLASGASGAAAAGFTGSSALTSWASSRGGSATPVSIALVSVGTQHACILDVAGKPWCWGANPTWPAIAGLNAENVRLTTIAAGGTSTCGQQLDGRLRCWGLLADYLVDGQRSPMTLLPNTTGATDDPLTQIVALGAHISVNPAAGNDSDCSCSASANFTAAPCQTLAGALTAAGRCSAASGDSLPAVTVWIRGRVLAFAALNASGLVIAQSVAMLQISGAAGSNATIVFPPCQSLPGQGAQVQLAACLSVPAFSVPGLVLGDVALEPLSLSTPPAVMSADCSSILSSFVLTRVSNIRLSGWNCTGALLSFSVNETTANAAFGVGLRSPWQSIAEYVPSAVFTAEVLDVTVTNITSSAVVHGRAMPAIRVASLLVTSSILESAVLVDQAVYARLQDVALRNVSSFSAATVSSLLPGSPVCGLAARGNNVGAFQATSVSAADSRLRLGAGGVGVCVTDADHPLTRQLTPRPVRVLIEDVDVASCSADAGAGAAVFVSLSRSPFAAVDVSQVKARLTAVSGSGGAVFASAASLSVRNVTCSDSFAGGDGGCVALDSFNGASVSAITSIRSIAGRAGGAVWLRSAFATSSGAAAIRSCSFTDCVALSGDGGGVSAVSVASVGFSSLVCTRSRAPRGSGGCIAADQTQALPNGVTTRSGSFSLSNVTAWNCAAAFRGGVASLKMAVLPGDAWTLSVRGVVAAASVVDGSLCAATLVSSVMQAVSSAITSLSSWWLESSIVAAGLQTASSLASVCGIGDDAEVGGGGVAVVFVQGSRQAGAAAVAVSGDGSVSSASGSIVSPRLDFSDVLFDGCEAGLVGVDRGCGGGLLLTRSGTAPSLASVSLRRVVAVNNRAAGSGGGISLRSAVVSTADVSVVNCTASAGDGGGIYAVDSSVISTPSLALVSNRALAGSGGGAAFSSCILGGLQLQAPIIPFFAPSASPSPSVTVTASATVSTSQSPSRSITSSAVASRPASVTATPSNTASGTRTVSPSILATTSQTPSPSVTALPTPSPSAMPLPGFSRFPVDALGSALVPGTIIVMNNSAAVAGGGIALLSCDAAVAGSVLLGNRAGEGGGLFATGNGALYACGLLAAANAASSFGGGLSLLDTTRESHVCDEAACSRIMLLLLAADSDASLGSSAGAGLPRVPFRDLLTSLSGRADSGVAAFGDAAAPLLRSLQRQRVDGIAGLGTGAVAPLLNSSSALWSAVMSSQAQLAGNPVQVSYAAASVGSNATSVLSGAGDAANCAWAANWADAAGGDVSFRSASGAAAVAAAGRAVSFLRRSFFYGSAAGGAGGAVFVGSVPASLSALEVVAAQSGRPYTCTGAGGASLARHCNLTASSSAVATGPLAIGGGGAVALYEPPYAELLGLRAVSTIAQFGGAVWIQPYAAQLAVPGGLPGALVIPAYANSTSLAGQLPATVSATSGSLRRMPAPALDGRLLVGGAAVSNSSSSAGGGGVFVQGSVLQSDAPSVLQLGYGSATAAALDGGELRPRPSAGAPAASMPVKMIIASLAARSADGSVSLVSLATSSEPLAVLNLTDSFGAVAAWDDSSVCTLTVTADDGISSLALMHQPDYTAVAGVVTLRPFGLASAPGSAGTAKVVCRVSLGALSYSLSATLVRVSTTRVRLALDAVADAAPPAGSDAGPQLLAPFCNSSVSFRRPAAGTVVARPVLLPVVAGARVWAADWKLRLTLTNAVEVAVQPPASLPCALSVASAVSAADGASVSASLIAVGDTAAASLDLAAASASVRVAVSAPAGAIVNLTASCRWPSGESVLAAAPLTIETARLHAGWVFGSIVPPTSNAIDTVVIGNASAAASAPCSEWEVRCGDGRPPGPCPLALSGIVAGSSHWQAGLMGSASFASWDAWPAWRLNATLPALGGTATAAATTAAAAAELYAVALTAPGAAASQLAIVAASLPVSASSLAPQAGSSPLRSSDWAFDWAAAGLASIAPGALPSSADGSQLLPLRPAPTLVLLATHDALPTALAFPAGTGRCTASLLKSSSSAGAGAGGAGAGGVILGTTSAALTSGSASFDALGFASLPLGNATAAQLRLQCTLSGSEAQPAVAIPLRSDSIRAAVVAAPAALQAPSSEVQLAAVSPPLTYALAVQTSVATAGGLPASVNASELLRDGSLAADIGSVGAKVLCSLNCLPSAQPCSFAGRTTAVIDASAQGGAGAAASLSFSAFGMASLAAHPASTCIAAQCTWLDGQRFDLPPVCMSQPAPEVVWCSDAGAACNSSVFGASSTGSLPQVAAPNEPLPAFAVQLQTRSPVDSLAALRLATGALRCSVHAAASAAAGAGGSAVDAGALSFRGSTEVLADVTSGVAVFSGLAFQLSSVQSTALETAGALSLRVSVSCSLNGQPFGSAAESLLRLPRLQVAWVQLPPAAMIPSAAASAAMLPPVAVSVTDAANASALVAVSGSCTLTIADRWLPPDSVAEGAASGATAIDTNTSAPASLSAFALLVGATTRPLIAGSASFVGLQLAASMGATLTLRASCTRSEGGQVSAAEWNVTIAHAAVQWTAGQRALPSLLLSGRPYPAVLTASWRLLPVSFGASGTPRWEWLTAVAADPVPAGAALPADMASATHQLRLQCSLALVDVSPAPPASALDAVQFSSAAVTTNTSSGLAAESLLLTVELAGAGGRSARFQPVCSTAGGVQFRAPARYASLATVEAQPLQPLPTVWLPSDGSSVTYVAPVPLLRLLAQDGTLPKTRGAVCTFAVAGGVGRAAGGAIAAATGGAAQFNVSATAATALVTGSDWTRLSVLHPPLFSPLLLNAPMSGYLNPPGEHELAPIAIDQLAIRAGFGDWVALRGSCTRSNRDVSQPLLALVRMGRMASAWLAAPPQQSSPGAIFNVSIMLYDADASSWWLQGTNATSVSSYNASGLVTAGGSMPLRDASDVFRNDFVSVCRIVVESATDGFGVELGADSVIVQGGSAAAAAGVVHMPAVALTSRVGTSVRGRVDCGTGSLLSPSHALTWSMAMAPCPPGSAPAGNGASCVNCGRSYSDGGPTATSCISCPSVGAACSGGVLSLLPGFYRADSNPTIDETTELHPCGLPFACWVNTTTTNRSAGLTHGCNEGYLQGSPLCGVCAPGYARTGKKCGYCPPPAANWAITAMVPVIVVLFGVWAAQRRISAASPFAPLTRIGLGHMQLLGALMGTFIASGTAMVREMLGFTEVVGASPLAMAPIHCALGGVSFYTRFFATLALAPALTVATGLAQVVLACRSRYGRKRGVVSSSSPAPGSGVAGWPHGARNAAVMGGSAARTGPEPGRASCAGRCRASIRRLLEDPRVTGPAVFVLNFLFPILITAGFNVFSCTPLPIAGVRYLTQDLSLACDTPTHGFMKILGAIVIGLAGFGIPLLLAFTLYKRRAQLYTTSTFSSLGFLYDGYDVARGRYAFESVVMLRKAGAVMIGNLVTDPHAQLTSAMLLLTVMAIAQLVLQPFAVGIWAALDALSLMSLLSTLALSLMYLRWSTPAGMCAGLAPDDVLPGTVLTCEQVQQRTASTEVAVTAVLMAMHIAVIGAFAAAYARLVQLQKLRQTVRAALISAAGAAAASDAGPPLSTSLAAGSTIRSPQASLGNTAPASAAAAAAAAASSSSDPHAGPNDDSRLRLVSMAVARLLAAEGRQGAGSLSSQTLPPSGGASQGLSRRSAAGRASDAAMLFLKRAMGPQQAAALSPQERAAAARVTPSLVTAAVTRLQHGRLQARGAFARALARAFCSPLTCMDAGLLAACEASEATTAEVFTASLVAHDEVFAVSQQRGGHSTVTSSSSGGSLNAASSPGQAPPSRPNLRAVATGMLAFKHRGVGVGLGPFTAAAGLSGARTGAPSGPLAGSPSPSSAMATRQRSHNRAYGLENAAAAAAVAAASAAADSAPASEARDCPRRGTDSSEDADSVDAARLESPLRSPNGAAAASTSYLSESESTALQVRECEPEPAAASHATIISPTTAAQPASAGTGTPLSGPSSASHATRLPFVRVGRKPRASASHSTADRDAIERLSFAVNPLSVLPPAAASSATAGAPS